jgi:hypothetical protein
MVAGSVACVASSMRHAWKEKRSRMSEPAPAHVAQITSARRSTPLMACYQGPVYSMETAE